MFAKIGAEALLRDEATVNGAEVEAARLAMLIDRGMERRTDMVYVVVCTESGVWAMMSNGLISIGSDRTGQDHLVKWRSRRS